MPGIAIAIAIGFSNNYPTFEQPRQACSQVFLRRGAIQRADGPNEAEAKGQVSRGGGGGGGGFGCRRLNCAVSLQLGGSRVNVRQLGGPGACSPGKLLNLSPLKWLEMHLKLSWCGEDIYTFSDKKRHHKKSFLHWNAWYNNNYSPNRRRCSITEVYLHVELKQPYLLQYMCVHFKRHSTGPRWAPPTL